MICLDKERWRGRQLRPPALHCMQRLPDACVVSTCSTLWRVLVVPSEERRLAVLRSPITYGGRRPAIM